ncbi:MAG TPA: Uma2 family endonuclease [Chthonomonadaceae bacterium]|nr:Uma2 family endonuclease [Chthonomonadaceae bacterium]
MANLLLECETERSLEARLVYVGERAIPFERFLDMAEGRWVELVQGVIVEKPMIQLNHERCSRWLYQVIGPYIERRGLGEMLSSRIMVKTETFGGRMPDLLFVRQERMDIVQQKAVYGAPDLIIEIISPSDRPSHVGELEADYFKLGVPELVFIHLQKQEIRLLRRHDEGYTERVITEGRLIFEALPGLELDAAWVLCEPRPDVFDTLNALFAR